MGEAKRVLVFAQGASHLSEANYCICHSFAQYQVPFAYAEVFKKAFLAGAEIILGVF